ncbi:MAG: hypothetical protein ACI4U5_05260 [Bacilli bacterium]
MKEQDNIYVGQVDILNDLNYDDKALKLDFFSYIPFNEIKCILEDETIAYTYDVEKNIPITSSSSNKQMFMHELKIYFEDEVKLEEVIMEFDNELLLFDIGSYQLKKVLNKTKSALTIDVMYDLNKDTYIKENTSNLKVTNLSKIDVTMIGLNNINEEADYLLRVTKINDLCVSANEAKISEELSYYSDQKYLTVSTYLSYEYSYMSNVIEKSNVLFKLEYDVLQNIKDLKEIDESTLSLGCKLPY